MNNPKFTIITEGGKIVSPSFKECTKRIRRLFGILAQKDGVFEIVGRKATKKRTNPQNAYYWGVVLPCITAEFKRLGNICDNELVHEFLKGKFGWYEYLTINGQEQKVRLSTTKYSKQDFINYLELIIQFANITLEIEIPEPI